MPDRLERLTNLVAVLLATRRPLTLEEIVARVPGYPDGKPAYRRQFERDKDTLRGIGVPLAVEPVHPLDSDVGYRVRPEDYYLPDLGLRPVERLALHAAVGAVRLEGGEGREALWKLGGLEGPEGPSLASLTSVPWLAEIFDAYRRRSAVSFSYRSERRDVDPHGILFRHGHWYLIGHDHRRGEARSFRLDRIEGAVEGGPPGSFEAPPGFDPTEALAAEPWRFGTETPVDARVLVDSRLAAWASNELGDEAIVERREDGSVVVSLSVTNRGAFRSFVLGLLDAAVVLGPPTLLADLLGWLEEIAASRGVAPAAADPTSTSSGSTGGRKTEPESQPAVTDGPSKARRADSAGRLRRLLAIIPWIVDHQGSSLEEIAARFGLEVRQLERDLELVPFCGLPPYTPDRLIDLAIVDGMVTVRFAEYLAAPLRLTPAEGFALLAAGRGLLAVPGSDPDGALAGALEKLGKVLGESGGIAIDLDPGRYLSPLQDAVAAGERVELEYYSFGRDALTRRTVDPYRVFAQAGEWYLEGYCHLAGDERLFRIDRIRSLERRGDLFELPAWRDPASEIYRPRPLDPRVVLVLPPEARWVVESYPTEEAKTLSDGSLRVVLAVSERGWLERLLLRVGPQGSVLSPPELVGVAQQAAARLLGLYGHRPVGTAREDDIQ